MNNKNIQLKIDPALQEVWGWKNEVREEYEQLGWEKFKIKLDEESRKFSKIF